MQKNKEKIQMKKAALIAGLIGLIGTGNAEAVLCDMINNIPSYS